MHDLNHAVAEQLREVADLLSLQEASPYRVVAYRRAANTVAALDESVATLLDRGGLEALVALPCIDRTLASMVRELVGTGRLALLDRLRGTLDPERLFQRIPGIGPRLARLLHDTLHVDTLEALEVAAHDGRLETVPGVGRRRAQAMRASLGELIGRLRNGAGYRAHAVGEEPAVELILDVDGEYRIRAERGELRTIAPRRFNPERESWLPILHAQRGPWHFTALYSNTERAHRLGRTHDWVIVCFSDGDRHERQRTVVTETHGPLSGRRVVRGREPECVRLAADSASGPSQAEENAATDASVPR